MEALVFGSLCRLVADKVGPCAAYTRGTHRLVCIDHDVVLSRLFDTILVVVNHPLGVMMISQWQNVSHVSGLDCGIVVSVHELIRRIETSFVTTDSSGGLVMHDHFDAFAPCVVVNTLDIEIGIGRNEIEDIVFLVATRFWFCMTTYFGRLLSG